MADEPALVADDEDMIVKLDSTGLVEGEDDSLSPAGAKAAAPAKDAKPEQVPPAVGVAELQQQLEESARQRERVAEQNRRLQGERDQAVAYAQEAERRGISAQEVMADHRLTSVQGQMDSLVEQQKGLYEAGDWGKVAEINRKLSELGGEKVAYERDKANFAWQREQAKQQQPQRQLPTDPVERATVGRTDRTADFIRKHPEIIRADGTFKGVALHAHEKAMDEGHSIDTDSYFSRIEEILKGEKSAETTSRDMSSLVAKPDKPRGAPTEAAPVSRARSSMVPGFDGENLRMTPKLRRLAEEQMQSSDPKDLAAWAKSYVNNIRTGRSEPIE